MSDAAMAWARAMRVSGASSKLVLLVLADRAGPDGVVHDCTQADIAAEAQLSERHVRRLIVELAPLLERTARPGEGRGRHSDVIRLRMSETPVILGRRRRQPDTMSGEATGHLSRQPDTQVRTPCPVAATGQKESSPTPPKEKLLPLQKALKGPKGSPAAEVIAAARPHFSKTGAKRLRPIPAAKALAPLIARHGLEPVCAAAKAFYADPYQHRDGGEYQPGLQVIANDGRLEALIAAEIDPCELQRRMDNWAFDRTWHPSWGPEPEGEAA